MKLPLRSRRAAHWPMCRDLMGHLTDYLEGVLTNAQVSAIDAHLAGCDGCDHALAQFRRTIELAGSISEDDVDALDPQVRDELLAAFRARGGGSSP